MTDELIRVTAIFALVSTALLSSACGSSSDGSGGSAGAAAMPTAGAGGDGSTPVMSNSGAGAGDEPGSAGASAQPPTGAAVCNSSNMVGTWELAGSGGVSVYATFESDGQFEIYFVAAAAAAGAFDVEEIVGTYTIAAGVYTTTATAFSCPSAISAGVSSCYIADGVLVATDLIKNTMSGWATAKAPSLSKATMGCFLPNDGGFMPYPLTPVP